jgi:hypothetical protein
MSTEAEYVFLAEVHCIKSYPRCLTVGPFAASCDRQQETSAVLKAPRASMTHDCGRINTGWRLLS